MAAGHYKLDNLCGIVDMNRLQIDGWVKDVMNVQPLSEKYAAFGWNVIEIDGNDMRQILDAFARARETSGSGPRYKNERESVTIIACGPMVPEAMRPRGF
jgi:transketolase N-terminal domain/subunit